MNLVKVLNIGNVLGECILWDELQQAFWWTDIEDSSLYRFHLESERLQSWKTPHRVASFGFVDSDSRLIVAFDRGIGLFNLDTGRVEWFTKPDPLAAGIRMNDGRVDRLGRFWVGSMVEKPKLRNGKGALYRVGAALDVSQVFGDVGISNGLCWSPDSKRMYHADSPTNTIWTYDFDAATGKVSNKQVFATTEKGVHPDGSTVDADGYVWNAQWRGSRVIRYTPAGTIDFELELPVTQPTCVAFGGKDLSLICVTSARHGLSADELLHEPHAGDVLIYQADVTGLAEPRFLCEL